MSSKRLAHLDLLRAIFCVAILLYHMSILKGGYLAVCSFFALSGYLSSKSLEKYDFSLKDYYINRLLRIYVPLVIIVLASLGICLLLQPDVVWVSMKQEVASLLFGYNNFWQLSANLDYFARHVDSPYMHLWYVAILIQLDLIFPLIMGLIQWAKGAVGKKGPVVVAGILSSASLIFFVYLHCTKGLMSAYYNTFARAFSWLFGILVGTIHLGYAPLVIKKIKDTSREIVVFAVLIVLQVVCYICVPAESGLYLFAMIFVTVLTCRLLEYAKSMKRPLPEWLTKVTRAISAISYEIYLIQYPVIYLFQNVKIPRWIANICIILIVLLVSALIHAALNLLMQITAYDVISFVLLIALLLGALYGGFRFVTAKNLQGEMKELEKELALEQEEQERKQKEYEEQLRKEEEEKAKEEEAQNQELDDAVQDIDDQIAEIEKKERHMWEAVDEMHICFVGDSVMLGAAPALYETFPKCYVDAQSKRTAYVINPIFKDLIERDMLGNPIVISCGANGDVPEKVKDEILETLADRDVFWMTTPNNPSANETLIDYAAWYPNLHVIDWAAVSKGHDEYFTGDGIHLVEAGKTGYAQAIRQGLHDHYVEELEKEKRILLEQKEDLKK